MSKRSSQNTDDNKTDKVGRPKIEFTDKDWRNIEGMCSIQCTGQEIADVMDVHYDTLAARVKETYGVNCSEYISKHSARGKMSLRRKQIEVANTGNTTMLIHLGKQYLGQLDKSAVDLNTNVQSMSDLMDELSNDETTR